VLVIVLLLAAATARSVWLAIGAATVAVVLLERPRWRL
jgi:hypothetical protein